MLVTKTLYCLTYVMHVIYTWFPKKAATVIQAFLGKGEWEANPPPLVYFSINWSLRKVHLPNNLFEQNSYKSVWSIKSWTFPACREGKPFWTPVYAARDTLNLFFLHQRLQEQTEYNTYFLNLNWACDSRGWCAMNREQSSSWKKGHLLFVHHLTVTHTAT